MEIWVDAFMRYMYEWVSDIETQSIQDSRTTSENHETLATSKTHIHIHIGDMDAIIAIKCNSRFDNEAKNREERNLLIEINLIFVWFSEIILYIVEKIGFTNFTSFFFF